MENEMQYLGIPVISESTRLNTILIDYVKEKRMLPKFEDYNETIKAQKKRASQRELTSKSLDKLAGLESKLKLEIEDLFNKISVLKYPHRSSVDLQSKLYGQMLINKAHQDFMIRPNDIHERLKIALELKENEYIFEIRDLYKNGKDVSDADKLKMKNFVDALEKEMGLTQLEIDKKKMDLELTEVRYYTNLLETSPEQFESRISNAIRVAKALKEAGKLEGESILLS